MCAPRRAVTKREYQVDMFMSLEYNIYYLFVLNHILAELLLCYKKCEVNDTILSFSGVHVYLAKAG